MRIRPNGNVGIGTDAPAALLHLKSTVNAAGPSLIFENTNNAQTMNIDYWNNSGAVQSRIQYAEGPAAWYFQPNISTGGESTLTIHYNGSVDVGGDPGGTVRTHGVVVSDKHKNGSLGTTLGDTQRVFGMHNISQNQDYLTFRTRRITDGQSGWNHSAWDITRDIDNTSDVYRYMTFGIGDVVINDSSANMDFRVESNTNANMLFVDGGTNRVGIGDGTPSHPLDVNGVLGLKGNAFLDSDGSSHYVKANTHLYFYPSSTGTCTMQTTGFHPMNDNAVDLGTTAKRWRNLYTTDLHLSNEGKPEGNQVDGTTGNWTIQEGEENLYIINNKSGKKYKFALEEIS
jgi:hypothetical protein